MIAAVLAVAGATAVIIVTRSSDGADKSAHRVAATGLPSAAVAPVERADLMDTLEISAEFRPFQEVNVYARAPGYVRQMHVDIGARLKAGDVIALLEIPELEDDVRRAAAAVDRAQQEVARAQASFDDAHVTYSRLAEVLKQQPNLVAEQEVDQARARDSAARASLDAARSAVREAEAARTKFATLAGYSRITAPFPGVVTKRFADTGSLVGAGTSSASQALVRLSQLDPLRLILPVPESAVPRIHPGAPVEVRVQATGEALQAQVARLSGEVSTDTRTMHVEVDVPNPALAFAPGMVTSATLVLDRRPQVLSIPIEAVPDRKGHAASAYVLDDRHRVERRDLTLGLETATRIEVVAGLREGDLVVLGGAAKFRPGEEVTPKMVTAPRPSP